MPELPEVETVVREIAPQVVGRTIERVRVTWPRTLGPLSPRAFSARVRGATVRAARRRGKYFIFDLDRPRGDGGSLVGHLRMSGRLAVRAADARPPEHGRVALTLDRGRTLDFVDTRKFGRLEWVPDPAARLAALGPEPLGASCTAAWFATALRGRRRQIKPLLLDQSFLAGLGNIYVDEALHRARIHPARRSHNVPRAAAMRLHGAIQDILENAIRLQGSSFDRFYRTPAGAPGGFQNHFRVYGRAGEPCGTCGASVRRVVVAQRGTHLCPRCQRPPRARSPR